jgi:hypothetical protein
MRRSWREGEISTTSRSGSLPQTAPPGSPHIAASPGRQTPSAQHGIAGWAEQVDGCPTTSPRGMVPAWLVRGAFPSRRRYRSPRRRPWYMDPTACMTSSNGLHRHRQHQNQAFRLPSRARTKHPATESMTSGRCPASSKQPDQACHPCGPCHRLRPR